MDHSNRWCREISTWQNASEYTTTTFKHSWNSQQLNLLKSGDRGPSPNCNPRYQPRHVGEQSHSVFPLTMQAPDLGDIQTWAWETKANWQTKWECKIRWEDKTGQTDTALKRRTRTKDECHVSCFEHGTKLPTSNREDPYGALKKLRIYRNKC